MIVGQGRRGDSRNFSFHVSFLAARVGRKHVPTYFTALPEFSARTLRGSPHLCALLYTLILAESSTMVIIGAKVCG